MKKAMEAKTKAKPTKAMPKRTAVIERMIMQEWDHDTPSLAESETFAMQSQDRDILAFAPGGGNVVAFVEVPPGRWWRQFSYSQWIMRDYP